MYIGPNDHQARVQGGGNCPQFRKDALKKFWFIKRLMCKSKKYFSELILLQLFVEPDKSNMIYYLSMINQMLCIV